MGVRGLIIFLTDVIIIIPIQITVCCIEVCMRWCARKQPETKINRGRKEEQEEPLGSWK